MSDNLPTLPPDLSPEERARLHRAARQVYRAGELPEEARAALESAVYPSEKELAELGL